MAFELYNELYTEAVGIYQTQRNLELIHCAKVVFFFDVV